MFVSAPRPAGGGVLNSNTIYTAGIAPSTGMGFSSEKAAIDKLSGTGSSSGSILYAQAERAELQSGVLGYKRYKNTNYRCSYMRRRVVTKGSSLFKSNYYSNRFATETAPIGIGYSGFFTTGVGDPTSVINPWGTSNDAFSVYNRTVINSLQRRGIVECKLKMLESKMDLAESLVDVDKTVALICRRITQVLTAWKYVRKGDFRNAARTLGISRRNLNFKTASEAWLEFIYGWRPLLSDIYSAVEVTKDLFGDPLKHHTYAKRRVKETLWVPDIAGNAGWQNMSSTHNSLCEVETKFRFQVQDSLLAYITGFQLSNPLYVFWVAMPFTFVVDWILPIGDWLGSLTATMGLKFVDGYQTTKTFASVLVKGDRYPHYSAAWRFIRTLVRGESIVESMYMRRVAFTSWPMSLTYFKFPFTSPERIASAIALTKATARLR